MILIQVAVVLAACGAVSWLLARLWQPSVVGQMLAGILLGPSLLGALAPEVFAWLFPRGGTGGIDALARLGLVFYMFMTGLRVDWGSPRRDLRSSSSVSLSGVLAPCVLGGAVALWLQRDGYLPSGDHPPLAPILFLAAALSITALPVLARIIQELRLEGTRPATIALSAAVIDDVIAWCLVAAVLALAHGDAGSLLLAVGGGMGMIAIAALVMRPLLRLSLFQADDRPLSAGAFGAIAVMVLALAWLGEATGLHAVFGAFLAGLAVPRGPVVDDLVRRLEPLTIVVLLPLFFANAGLVTEIGLIDAPGLWMALAAVVVAAVAGKGIACWLAAQAGGVGGRDAFAIGILMNARGLTGMVVASIGLEKGLVSPAIYTIIVSMCLLTTAAAAPLLYFLYRRQRRTPKI